MMKTPSILFVLLVISGGLVHMTDSVAGSHFAAAEGINVGLKKRNSAQRRQVGFQRTAALSEVQSAEDCPQDWLYNDGSCYFVNSLSISFFEAMIMCYSMDAQILEIDSKEENVFVFENYRKTIGKRNHIWTGVVDYAVEGQYQLVSNKQSPNYFSWKKNKPIQPDNWNSYGYNDGEDCTVMLKTGDWSDIPCAMKASTVCEMRYIAE